MIRRSKRIVQYYSKEERSVDSPKKKAKKKSEIRIPNTFYTNVKMPSTYEFGSLKENEIKLLSYNVAGLNASINKGLKEYLLAENADVFFLQETKLSHNLVEPLLDEKIYPYQFYNNCTSKKGYSGTYLASKVKPIQVSYGINNETFDLEGRVITAEFQSFFLVTCYIPNSGEKLRRLAYKVEFNKEIESYVKNLELRKPIVWGGDFNVSHTENDLSRPKANMKNSGFTQEERSDFTRFLSNGYIDTWRHFNPEVNNLFSYYSYRFQCRSKGLGWRIDYFLVSANLMSKVVESKIRYEAYGASDHCPLILTLKDLQM